MTLHEVGPSRRRRVEVVVLLLAATGIAVGGAVVVGSFHGEYGDITRSVYVQGLQPGLVIAVLAAIPASLAVALRPRAVVVAVATLAVVSAVPATILAMERGVTARELSMPRTPLCTGGDPADEGEPDKAKGVQAFEAAVAPYQRIFAELPSPGRFGAGSVSVDGCGAMLVNVGPEEAYAFYERELPAHGWTITERAPGEMLIATRGEYSFAVGMAVTEGSPSVEVYRTGSTWTAPPGDASPSEDRG